MHVKLDVREAGCQPRAVPRRQVRQRLQRVLAVLACRRSSKRKTSLQPRDRFPSLHVHAPMLNACLHATRCTVPSNCLLCGIMPKLYLRFEAISPAAKMNTVVLHSFLASYSLRRVKHRVCCSA